MATVGNTYPTLLDVSKNFSPDGQPLPIAELLHETNEILDDIPWQEANSTNGHKISARAGLPESTFRKLNAGVAPSKSDYQDITESMGMLSALGKIDKKLADLSPNVAEFRMRENKGHIESMNQTFSDALIYGDTDVNPERFLGLAPRFDDTGAGNGAQIIDGGGASSTNCSIWLVGWGDMGAYGIYPKGSQAGLVHKDMGVELVSDGNGGEFPAYRDWFEWDCGVAVKDWRNIVRVANVDVETLTKDAQAGADLIDLMVQVCEQINSPSSVRLAFYVPRTIRSYLRRQITNRSNVWLSQEEVAGRKVVAFDGIPVRRLDSLLETESAISFS